MNTQKPKKHVNIDPLDTLTKEQKQNLSQRVVDNINSFLQLEGHGRPGSDWNGYELYKEHQSDVLFERMVFEVLNRNFDKSNLQGLERGFTYLNDFTTQIQDAGFDVLKRKDPWVKQTRKNLVDYLLKAFSSQNMQHVHNAAAFIRLMDYAIANVNETIYVPDKWDDPQGWVEKTIDQAKHAHKKVQQLKQTI